VDQAVQERLHLAATSVLSPHFVRQNGTRCLVTVRLSIHHPPPWRSPSTSPRRFMAFREALIIAEGDTVVGRAKLWVPLVWGLFRIIWRTCRPRGKFVSQVLRERGISPTVAILEEEVLRLEGGDYLPDQGSAIRFRRELCVEYHPGRRSAILTEEILTERAL